MREDGATSIAIERQRQIETEGYTTEHDADHSVSTLVNAAEAYLGWGLKTWPWSEKDFKPDPTDDGMYHRRDLVKAGALIAAAIDRLDASLTKN